MPAVPLLITLHIKSACSCHVVNDIKGCRRSAVRPRVSVDDFLLIRLLSQKLLSSHLQFFFFFVMFSWVAQAGSLIRFTFKVQWTCLVFHGSVHCELKKAYYIAHFLLLHDWSWCIIKWQQKKKEIFFKLETFCKIILEYPKKRKIKKIAHSEKKLCPCLHNLFYCE